MIASFAVDACIALGARKNAALALVDVDAALGSIRSKCNFVFKAELYVSVSVISRVTNAVVSFLHQRIRHASRLVMTSIAATETVVIVETHPSRVRVVTGLEGVAVMSGGDALVSILTYCHIALGDALLVNIARMRSSRARVVRNGVGHTIVRGVVVHAMSALLANVQL